MLLGNTTLHVPVQKSFNHQKEIGAKSWFAKPLLQARKCEKSQSMPPSRGRP